MFQTCLVYLKHLLNLIEAAEEFGALPGAAKKARVTGEFCQMLADLPAKEKKNIPGFLLNPENIGCLVDLAVAMANFVSCRKSAYLVSLAKSLLTGGEDK